MGMKIGIAIGPDGKKEDKDSNEKWQDFRSHPKLSFSKDFRKMIGFLSIALLTFNLSVLDAFAGPDSFASVQNPLAYSVVSASHESSLPLHSVTVYLSGREDLPTTVYLPTITVRKIGMDSPKGWIYESRTINTPVYRKSGEDPSKRALVTEIEIVSLPKARESDLVALDDRERIFLLHLIPRPKMIGKIPFYSRNVTWWPPYGSFPSEGLWPLEKTTGSIPAPLSQRSADNHRR